MIVFCGSGGLFGVHVEVDHEESSPRTLRTVYHSLYKPGTEWNFASEYGLGI